MLSQVLLFVGVVCLVVALAFGLLGQTVSVSSSSSAGPAPQGAACGFAVAGGLCFLGAAVAARYAAQDRAGEQAARNANLEERIHQLEQELAARMANWEEEQRQS